MNLSKIVCESEIKVCDFFRNYTLLKTTLNSELSLSDLGIQIAVSIALFLIAMGTAFIIDRFGIIPNFRKVKYQSLEGLRGFLALGVVVHHFWTWLDYCKDNSWGKFQSGFILQLGNTSVLFFFAITGFLFFEKILDTEKQFNYWNFILNRIKRLAPAFYFSAILICLIVFYRQNWELKVDFMELIDSLRFFVTFGLFGTGIINNFGETLLVNAGIMWTLKYEWLFYLSLPLFRIFFDTKMKNSISIILSLFMVGEILWLGSEDWEFYYVRYFFMGATAAFILKNDILSKYLKVAYWDYLLLIGLGLLYLDLFPHHFLRDIFIFGLFVLIVCGNSIVGFLNSKSLMLLGRISYSVYLLHGILYYLSFRFVIDCQYLNSQSGWVKVLVGFVLMPVLIGTSSVSFLLIESPFILKTRCEKT